MIWGSISSAVLERPVWSYELTMMRIHCVLGIFQENGPCQVNQDGSNYSFNNSSLGQTSPMCTWIIYPLLICPNGLTYRIFIQFDDPSSHYTFS